MNEIALLLAATIIAMWPLLRRGEPALNTAPAE